ncbi:hypothetical protein CDL15_Pgr016293 [Punica granatum]|uniref:Uncharacterized protein n=1 Tax=Punica granatum TaxID=22663 RepID=A0A218W6D1_PUNGR|nr:hypothetical protein CDL15_Pgr016293 [Punica granatum]
MLTVAATTAAPAIQAPHTLQGVLPVSYTSAILAPSTVMTVLAPAILVLPLGFSTSIPLTTAPPVSLGPSELTFIPAPVPFVSPPASFVLTGVLA